MVEHTYRLLSLLSDNNEIVGRKRLQKMFFIFQSLGYNFDLEYTYQHYGPYSSQLQLETDLLGTEGLITERFDEKKYSYSVTEAGRNFMREIEEKGLMGSFHRVPVEAINRLQQQDAELLELVSTILYLTELGLEEEELYRKLQELKPRLFHRVDEAQEFISGLYYWKRERRDQ